MTQRGRSAPAGYHDCQCDDGQARDPERSDVEDFAADLQQSSVSRGQGKAGHSSNAQKGANDQATKPPGVFTGHRDDQPRCYADHHDQQRPQPLRSGRSRLLHWPPHEAASCSARSTTLLRSIARVIGPTPPGTGATRLATSYTLGSRSPTRPFAVRVMPTSTHTAPVLIMLAVIRPGRPAAATTISAAPV